MMSMILHFYTKLLFREPAYGIDAVMFGHALNKKIKTRRFQISYINLFTVFVKASAMATCSFKRRCHTMKLVSFRLDFMKLVSEQCDRARTRCRRLFRITLLYSCNMFRVPFSNRPIIFLTILDEWEKRIFTFSKHIQDIHLPNIYKYPN